MRELELFEQYLIRLRQEKLQGAHMTLLGDFSDTALREARTRSYEAELIQRIVGALRELKEDPGEFIKGYLK